MSYKISQWGQFDLAYTGPGESRWHWPLPTQFTTVGLNGVAAGAAGLPQGIVNIYSLSLFDITAIAATTTWDWLPQSWSFGVVFIVFGY